MTARPIPEAPERLRTLPPYPLAGIPEAKSRLIDQGRDVMDLGAGDPGLAVPDIAIEALREAAAIPELQRYGFQRGLPRFRESIVSFMERRYGRRLDPDREILPLVGSKEGLSNVAFAAVAPGSISVVPDPGYAPYFGGSHLAGARVHRVPLRREAGFLVPPDELRRLPGDLRLVYLNYPNNPTGATLDGGALTELAAVARAHGVLVISDEIYGLVDHDGTHATLSKYYHEGTIVSTGISKWCGAGGWRLGALLFPQELRWLADAMAAAASETFSSVSAPIQHAATVAYRGGPEIDEYLRHSRRIMRALGRSCASSLDGCGLVVNRPEGGFYLFPSATPLTEGLKARGIETSEALCNRLLADTGVALLPGSVFGRPVDELTFRLSYVDFDGHAALQGSMATNGDLDEAFLRTYCPRVIDAMTAMVEWFPKRDA
jgi:aspartate aminotransferase